jgi:NAD(P)-dependent dehydrogenase (short-subunit alcohol dehydrogenase family)
LEAEGPSPVLLEAHSRYPSPAALPSPAEALSPYFPPGQFDADGQQVDRRPENSWSAKLGGVDTLEALEVQLVNAVSPFLLCNRLRPLLCRSPFGRRFVVNVSAMEGQFGRERKTARHPHTNMAKAALNMLTRTSAQDLREDGIYLTSVDTGWVTDENPFPKAARLREDQHFFTPLDSVDGAARVYDPVARGVNEPDVEPFWGVFLKDYAPHPW